MVLAFKSCSSNFLGTEKDRHRRRLSQKKEAPTPQWGARALADRQRGRGDKNAQHQKRPQGMPDSERGSLIFGRQGGINGQGETMGKEPLCESQREQHENDEEQKEGDETERRR